MTRISVPEFAHRFGVEESAVRKAARAGRISIYTDAETGEKFLDLESATAEWEANTDVSKNHHEMLKEEPPAEGIHAPVADDEEEAGVAYEDVPGAPGVKKKIYTLAADYKKSRAEREHYNAHLARLKYEEAAGRLIDADKALNDSFRAARIVRDALMNIPDRVAGEFAGEKNQFAIHKRLTDEIRQALSTLEFPEDEEESHGESV